MILSGQLDCAHDDVVGGILPGLVGGIIYAIGTTGKIQTLGDFFMVGVEDVAPLE